MVGQRRVKGMRYRICSHSKKSRLHVADEDSVVVPLPRHA